MFDSYNILASDSLGSDTHTNIDTDLTSSSTGLVMSLMEVLT